MGTSAQAELRGGRWLYAEPTSDEVREWFRTQPLHEDMSHERYLGGIVLIPAKEKYWDPQIKESGELVEIEQRRRTYTPYMSVSTRISYFWDFIAHLNHGRVDGPFKGKIKPVAQDHVPEGPLANTHLPEGFSLYATMQGQQMSVFVVCTTRVEIIERKSEEVLLEATDSRMIPAGEEYALMTARTGSVGRALGMAGMLVIGTGVASAEEVQYAMDSPATPRDRALAAVLPESDLPIEPVFTAIELRERINVQIAELRELKPDAYASFTTWWREREFPGLDNMDAVNLETVHRKLERDIDAARQP